jgi:hypothetical protein
MTRDEATLRALLARGCGLPAARDLATACLLYAEHKRTPIVVREHDPVLEEAMKSSPHLRQMVADIEAEQEARKTDPEWQQRRAAVRGWLDSIIREKDGS